MRFDTNCPGLGESEGSIMTKKPKRILPHKDSRILRFLRKLGLNQHFYIRFPKNISWDQAESIRLLTEGL
jgi:hypothetical protein